MAAIKPASGAGSGLGFFVCGGVGGGGGVSAGARPSGPGRRSATALLRRALAFSFWLRMLLRNICGPVWHGGQGAHKRGGGCLLRKQSVETNDAMAQRHAGRVAQTGLLVLADRALISARADVLCFFSNVLCFCFKCTLHTIWRETLRAHEQSWCVRVYSHSVKGVKVGDGHRECPVTGWRGDVLLVQLRFYFEI